MINEYDHYIHGRTLGSFVNCSLMLFQVINVDDKENIFAEPTRRRRVEHLLDKYLPRPRCQVISTTMFYQKMINFIVSVKPVA